MQFVRNICKTNVLSELSWGANSYLTKNFSYFADLEYLLPFLQFLAIWKWRHFRCPRTLMRDA
jgi:hypothetical protein